jgi:hypothetical protein
MHIKMSVRLRHFTLMVLSMWPGGVLLLWPVPAKTERDFPVWEASRKAAEMAKTDWVQMVWSEVHRDYIIESAEGEIPEPVWPACTMTDLLIQGFADRVIDSEEHPYVRRLRGLAN